jgi:SAM-dependent methyltransferase
MKLEEKEKIREAVREKYGNLAKTGNFGTLSGQTAGCCSPDEASVQIADRVPCCGATETSVSIEGQGASCCGSGEISIERISTLMGYSKKDVESVPEGANMGVGCGNPVAIASLQPGETVVDLGSGGGFDCFLAARQVGENGKIIGVDMTPDMISKARRNAEKIDAPNVEFRLGEIEHLPVGDNTADIIMSNCVINLSPDKKSVYQDAFRVLKPGGRLAISDVVATAPVPEDVRTNLAMLSACVGGAQLVDELEETLAEIGFKDVVVKPNEASRKLISKWAPGNNAGDYVVSAYIQAVKPI